MDINKKREILQEYYYNREYTIKEKIITGLYWFIKLIVFALAIFFLVQNFNNKISGIISFTLFTIYYILFKEYSAIKYKYYDKVFEYSEIINQVKNDKIKKIINESDSIYEIKDKLEQEEE